MESLFAMLTSSAFWTISGPGLFFVALLVRSEFILKPREIRAREGQRLLEEVCGEPCSLTRRILEAYKPYQEGERLGDDMTRGGCFEGSGTLGYRMSLRDSENPYPADTRKGQVWARGFSSAVRL